MIVTIVDALDTRLKDATAGVAAQLSSNHASATALAKVYNSWDVPERGTLPQVPSLAAIHVDVPDIGEASQSKRDNVHRFEFWYASAEVDQTQRRKDAAWTLDALLRCIDPLNASPADTIGGGATVLTLRDASVLYGMWDRTNNIEYTRLLVADITVRDDLS